MKSDDFARERFLPFCIGLNSHFIISEHHRLIAKKLEEIESGKCDRLIINMPPRHGKSYLCSQFFPAWYLGKNPSDYIISASYGQDLANDFGRNVRNIMVSDSYKSIFGGVNVSQDSKSQKKFSTSHDGSYVAVGRGGSITGRGGHLVIIDDLLKNEVEARSEQIRSAMKDWYRNTLYTRLMPGGKIIIINTRWHLDDLCGWLLNESSDEWEILNLPAIKDGEALWPEYYNIDTLNKIKAEIGTQAFEALYQQRPVAEKGNLFKKDWIQHWVSLPSRFDEMIQSWDLTFKGNNTSDYVVGQVWGRWRNDYYLVDQVRGQWDFTETVRQVENLTAKYPLSHRKVIEDKANGPAVVSHLKSKIHGFKLWNPKTDKTGRAHAITPVMESQNVYLPPLENVWVEKLVHELLSFPNAKNDDQVDAFTQALLNLIQVASTSFATSGKSLFA